MSEKYTPGPWEVESGTGSASGLSTIRDTRNNVIVFQMKQAANARLIAAAPELLEALKAITEAFPRWPLGRMRRARAAIAKAEGR